MDIYGLMATINNMRKENAGCMTLGELTDAINPFDDNKEFTLSNGKFLTGQFGSYRGYYEDIAFDYLDQNTGINTIGQLKELISKAYKQESMTGYKGGDFPIDNNTLVWIGHYGTTGGSEQVVSVNEIDGKVYLIVKPER